MNPKFGLHVRSICCFFASLLLHLIFIPLFTGALFMRVGSAQVFESPIEVIFISHQPISQADKKRQLSKNRSKIRVRPSTNTAVNLPEPEVMPEAEPESEQGVNETLTESRFDENSARPSGDGSAYLAALRSRIQSFQHYPFQAKVRHEKGMVLIEFTILKDGSVTDVRVAHGSSFSNLDQAALRAVLAIRKFNPIPEEFHRERWAMVVPLTFKLD
jgi:periplasmic protein TonB